MESNALNEIRKAESEAEKIVEAARQKSANIISEARSKAALISRESESELAKKKGQMTQRLNEKIALLRQKAIDDGTGELKSIRKPAEERIESAVETVLAAFEREIKK